MSRGLGLVVAAIAIFGVVPSASATSRCPILFRTLFPLETEHTQDVGVELEVAATREALALLTTNNGKVGGLLLEQPTPRWLEEIAKARGIADVRQAPWDRMGPDVQRRLLKEKAVWLRLHKTFHEKKENRLIDGMRVRDFIDVEFTEPTDLLGVTYPPGTHAIEIGKIFDGRRVEFVSKHAGQGFSGFELHFRAGKAKGDLDPGFSAGTASQEASNLLRTLGITPPHQHVHIVAPLRLEELRSDPSEVAATSDFVRRANLLLEMQVVAEYREGIRKIDDGTRFGFLDPDMLDFATRYFEKLKAGSTFPLQSFSRIAFAGVQPSNKYDDWVHPIWGLEVRMIPKGHDEAATGKTLDTFQHAMLTGDYGVPREKLARWLRAQGHKPGRSVAKLMANQNYHQSWKTLFSRMAPDVARELPRTGLFSSPDRDRLQKLSEDNDAVKMLVHDWSGDLLTFEQPQLARKIATEQVRALRRLAKDEPPAAVLRTFLVRSGLYEATLRSFASAPVKLQ